MNVKEPAVLKAPNIDKPDKKYELLARRLGVHVSKNPSDILLKAALSDLSIGVYDLSAVRAYLIEKKPDNQFFCWSPVGSKHHASGTLDSKFRQFGPRGQNHGFFTSINYNKPIPFAALLTMDLITKKAKELGFEPRFFISDYSERRARPRPNLRLDPFLAVGTSDSDALFVIERWDEPGFREEAYSSKKKASGKAAGKENVK